MQHQECGNGKFALDEWTKIYPAPTAIPFELKPTGSTFRGMNDQGKASEYAEKVSTFFAEHNLDIPVFVVRGPTSTTKCKFEVVTAIAGYTVVFKIHRTGQKEVKQICIGQPVKVWINSVLGAIPAVVVRDMTDVVDVARIANPMDGESVYEIRYTAGPNRGAHAFAPARDLRLQ